MLYRTVVMPNKFQKVANRLLANCSYRVWYKTPNSIMSRSAQNLNDDHHSNCNLNSFRKLESS